VWHELQALDPLQPTRTSAPEPKEIKPVSDKDLNAVLPHLTKTLAAMAQVQRLTGMRPNEVCQLRGADIDRSGAVWVFRPRRHKCQHLGKQRAVQIGPKTQRLLQPFLKLDPEALLFTPGQSEDERARVRRQARKSKVSPSQQRRDEQARVQGRRTLQPAWTTASYRRAIARACDKAGVARWAPNRLRHTRGTEVMLQMGADAAGAALGHSKLETTRIYLAHDDAMAEEVARRLG